MSSETSKINKSILIDFQTVATQNSQIPQTIATNRKIGTLFVNTNQTIQSKDGTGERQHYKVTLISKDGQEVEISQQPIDIKKLGEVKQIVITDGANETVLKDNMEITAARLIKYLTTDFDTFRKEINKDNLDHNGIYPARNYPFDCQRFCYYMQYGQDAEYGQGPMSDSARDDSFRKEGRDHKPGRYYAIKAYPTQFGKNGHYDLEQHYYICLANDVFVSKFGQSKVLFTSYKQLVDAYFPPNFTRGVRYEPSPRY